ncbi:PleD family two-component system response regulator [Geminocystis sp. NIES-3709]|uniref:response regulator n=1 Tax=Geminocystis sp. NIES-3709 TaxID=1617448 RepID=UPI0005FC9E22|nr:response regulator [Geminocystis sp. NIES-3709]BAQ66417.1 serine phosphatase RsbU [Geminocystis sp. NIES-3709]
MYSSELINPEESIILLVDDLKQNLKLLTFILEAENYQTSFALSGKDALERLNVLTPDLILLDLMMPDMSGLEVCQKIKSNDKYKDIPIIFLTASQEEHHLVEAYTIGASDYVTKPFKKQELLSRVATQLTIKSQIKYISKLKKEINQLKALKN